MKILGFGASTQATHRDLLDACEAVLQQNSVDGIATLDRLHLRNLGTELAASLQLPLHLLSLEEANLASGRCLTSSAVSTKETGLGSVAESTALAAAGPGSRLEAPRSPIGRITLAIAISGDTP